MTQKRPRRDVSERTTPLADGRPNRLFALLERVVDSIAAAGPVGWISIVVHSSSGMSASEAVLISTVAEFIRPCQLGVPEILQWILHLAQVTDS